MQHAQLQQPDRVLPPPLHVGRVPFAQLLEDRRRFRHLLDAPGTISRPPQGGQHEPEIAEVQRQVRHRLHVRTIGPRPLRVDPQRLAVMPFRPGQVLLLRQHRRQPFVAQRHVPPRVRIARLHRRQFWICAQRFPPEIRRRVPVVCVCHTVSHVPARPRQRLARLECA